MPDITLEGVVYHVPYRSSKDRIQSRVFVDEKYHNKLDVWWRENRIDTKMEKLSHPILHKKWPQIQATSTAKNIKHGTQVNITPTTIHKVQVPMQPVSVSDEKDKPDGSSFVSMRQGK